LSQYGFAGGDPIGNSDPSGHKVCFGVRNREEAIEATKRATNTEFDVDDDGCVIESTVQLKGGGQWLRLQESFLRLVRSTVTWDVLVTGDRGSSISGNTVFINMLDATSGSYKSGDNWVRWNGEVAASIAHELLGHGDGDTIWNWGVGGLFSTPLRERNGLMMENEFLRAIGKPERTSVDAMCFEAPSRCSPFMQRR
jgi:hypothetical protein